MELNLSPAWQALLADQINQEYFKNLWSFVGDQYAKHTCFPAKDNIFNALNTTPLANVKVVILGQDPYHGKGQAHGLSFSVPNGVKLPPSLVNIFKELALNLDTAAHSQGDLTHWANQGVLLLNATLTVRESEAGSHQNQGWEQFTDAIINTISNTKRGVVFMLWGGYAKKKTKLIDASKHLILATGHPSPLSANRGYWFGNNHFSKANAYLEARGETAIKW